MMATLYWGKKETITHQMVMFFLLSNININTEQLLMNKSI